MGARIPSALIPSSKKRHSSWKILFIRLLGASVFFLPLLLFVSTNSFGTRRANLSSDEYLWIGYLSAYFCNVNNSRLSAQEGKTILDNLVATNRLPDSLVQNQELHEVAILNSTTFSRQCTPSRPDGDKGIDEIYAKVLSRNKYRKT